MTDMYIAACSENGGIYHYSIDEKGRLEAKSVTKLDRPMYMCIEGKKMHILLRAPFESGNSGVISYDITECGKLCNPSRLYDTGGTVACHISAAGDRIFCANYVSGSVCSVGKKLVEHSGKTGSDKNRQDKAHAHQMCLAPDGKYVCAVDLGLDAVIIYDLDLNEVNRVNVPDSYGARHCVFSADGQKLFVLNELTAHVSVFSFNTDTAECEYINSFSSREGTKRSEIAAAAVRISGDGRFLYISDRGDNTISRFEIDGFELKNMKKFPCGGVSPRDFDFTPDGRFVIVTNEKTDNVCVFEAEAESGDIRQISEEKNIENPLCVIFN